METSTDISAEAIRAQLEKILASPGFIHSDRMVRLLRFTVEQALTGHGSELKETVLGMEVFDRPSSFDPRTDTIVRVEARRLRPCRLANQCASHPQRAPLALELAQFGRNGNVSHADALVFSMLEITGNIWMAEMER